MPVSLLLLKSLCSLKHGFHQQCKYNHNWNSYHLQWKQLRLKHKDQNFSFFFYLHLSLYWDCFYGESRTVQLYLLFYLHLWLRLHWKPGFNLHLHWWQVCFPSSVLATVCYDNDSLFEGYIIPKVFLHSSSHSESSGEKTHDTWKKSAICVQRERSSE